MTLAFRLEWKGIGEQVKDQAKCRWCPLQRIQVHKLRVHQKMEFHAGVSVNPPTLCHPIYHSKVQERANFVEMFTLLMVHRGVDGVIATMVRQTLPYNQTILVRRDRCRASRS
jgi:hypothetical protein